MGPIAALINDPTVRTLTYVGAAALCAGAFRAARRLPREARASLWVVWLAIAIVMVGFAVLRETDLERTVGRQVREFAQARGWYPDRRPLQEFVIGTIAIGGMGAAIVGSRFVRYPHWELTFGLMALIYLTSFVIIRAVSLHEVDFYLYDNRWRGVQLSNFFEVLGTASVALAAALAIRSPAR